MEKSKKKWIKIVAISLSVVIVLGAGIWGLIYFLNRDTYKPDWELAAKLKTRAANAQYLPDSSKLVGDTAQSTLAYSAYSSSTDYISGNSMTLDEYNELIEEIGSIWHPYHGDYNISDVKDMVIYLCENVGVFDRWFRYHGSTVQETEANSQKIPRGLSDGDFYMSYNERTEHIRIIQCMSFQEYAYDSDTNQVFWNGEENRQNGPSYVNKRYQSNWPVLDDNVLIIDYYYTGEGENRKEVVEAEIIEYIHVYNKTVICGYQKIKNIKDTCFTRYEINCVDFKKGENSEEHSGIDYKNPIETGIRSNYLQIDYTDSSNVAILKNTVADGRAYDDDSILDNERSVGLLYNAIENGSKVKFQSYFKATDAVANSSERESSGTVNFERISNTFVSLLDSLTGSDKISSGIDFSDTAENKYEQKIFDNLNLAIQVIVEDSYIKENYESGLNIWNRDAEDITDKIHKPSE